MHVFHFFLVKMHNLSQSHYTLTTKFHQQFLSFAKTNSVTNTDRREKVG